MLPEMEGTMRGILEKRRRQGLSLAANRLAGGD
jgi:hypothetical protein